MAELTQDEYEKGVERLFAPRLKQLDKEFKVECNIEVGGFVCIKAKDAEEAEEKVRAIVSNYGHDCFSQTTFDNLSDSEKWDKLEVEWSKISSSLEDVDNAKEVRCEK